MTSPRIAGIGAVAALLVVRLAVPGALPDGVVVQGALFGSTSGLLALGLVLTYQASRVVNFAQGAIGSLAGGIGVSLYLGPGWPWWAALVTGAVAGLAVGALIDVLVVRRFADASRLTLTVATIGLAQLLGGLSLLVPGWLGAPVLVGAFDTGLSDITLQLRPVLFTGNELLMVILVVIIVAGLGWLLSRTDVGMAVRGAAENRDRARLLAIPVGRLSTFIWATAGALAAVTVLLGAPAQGMSNSLGAAPVVLLPALAAAVIARMSSLSVAFGAAVALGVVDQLVRWHVTTSSVTSLVFLAIIAGTLTVRGDISGRSDEDGGIGSQPTPTPTARADGAEEHDADEVPAPRPLSARRMVPLVAVAAAVVAPQLLSSSDLFLLTTGAVYAMVAVSLVALTGWSGQVSLGQFGIVGVGAVVSANLVLRFNLDLFWSLTLAGVAGALVATLIGLPALRIRGPFLAVTTLAFAVAADSWAFNPNNFAAWLPFSVDRPVLLGRVDLGAEVAYSYLVLTILAVTVAIVIRLKRGRPGRSMRAVSDNREGAAALALPAKRIQLGAFLFAGAVAGVAGGLHVHLLGGLGAGTFGPGLSIAVFSMAVIGGIDSPGGAVAGVAVVQVVGRFFPEYQFVLSGIGVLVLLLIVPGGLAELARRMSRRGGTDRRSPAPAGSIAGGQTATGPVGDDASASSSTTDRGDLVLECTAVSASYRPLRVLFGADLHVRKGEVVALLGTNGAGKSTLLRTITGLLPIDDGDVVLGDTSLRGRSVESIAASGVAMVPGGRGVFPSLTVEENLRLAAWPFRNDRERVRRARHEALDTFPALRERLDQRTGTLSGGEQQMLALAQAFMGDPDVLLIDELSLGLAPAIVGELLEVLRARLARGVTIVLVEQSVNVALTVAERAVFLEKGAVKFSGPTADLLDRPDVLRSVFLAPNGAASASAAQPTTPVTGGGRGDDRIVLACHDLRKQYGGVTAVDGVDLELRSGQVLGLIGHNGAGKTTLFDLVSGFVAPDDGRIELGGDDITSLTPSARAVHGLGRSFQAARLFSSLTVEQTLSVALDRHLRGRGDGLVATGLRLPAAVDNEEIVAVRVEEIIETLNLRPYATSVIASLSTGTRRIVEIGCMLALSPDVLLLDEPSAGVAQREVEQLGPLLQQVRDATGCSIMVIEHDMALLSSMCDELVALEHGAVITSGSPADVLEHPEVISSYLGTDDTAVRRSSAPQGANDAHDNQRKRPDRVDAAQRR